MVEGRVAVAAHTGGHVGATVTGAHALGLWVDIVLRSVSGGLLVIFCNSNGVGMEAIAG